jgi:hypothetical protein
MLPIASDSKSAGLLSLQIRGRGDPFFLAKSAGDAARMRRRRRSSSGTSNDPDTAKNVFLNSSCLLKTKGIKRTYCSEMRRERERERAPDNLLLKNSIELEEEDDENFFFFFEFRFERRGCCCCK